MKDEQDLKIKIMRYFFQYGIVILVSIFISLFLRIFILTSFYIPTPSMEPTILPGDKVIVNKLIPGPRIMTNFLKLKKGEEPLFKRLKGYRNIQRNDILVFNFPYLQDKKITLPPDNYYAKRCIGLPGDTFYIENGIYKVTGIEQELGNIKDQIKFFQIPNMAISQNAATYFPQNESYQWNSKQFGPLYLPAIGDNLQLSEQNILLYKSLIEYETGKIIRLSNSQIFLNDSLITQYAFHKNYYFMAGDLVHDSLDSRYWGPLPEDHIVGKAVLVLYSKNPLIHKIRWKRIFKTIH